MLTGVVGCSYSWKVWNLEEGTWYASVLNGHVKVLSHLAPEVFRCAKQLGTTGLWFWRFLSLLISRCIYTPNYRYATKREA
jgi:hypothetical protein